MTENTENKEEKYIPRYKVWKAGSGTPVITITEIYKALNLKTGDEIEIDGIIRKVKKPRKEKPQEKDTTTEQRKMRYT